MKKLLFPILMMTLATMILAALPTEAEGAIYDDTVRLHILAVSDSEYDQRIKLELRDEILGRFGAELSAFEGADEASVALSARLEEIERFANEELAERGYPERATASIGTEWYETRDYGEFSLPAGYYTSLKIVIGEGEGENWWCVMFPPLCLDTAIEDDVGYTDAEEALVVGKYTVKFKLLELISSITK